MKINWTEQNRILARMQARGDLVAELVKAQLSDGKRLKELDESGATPEFEVWE